MPLLLTTTDRVKAYLEASGKAWSSGGMEALATQLIGSVSRAIQRHLKRELLLVERTEDFRVDPGQRCLWLPAYPVTEAEVRLDLSREFGDDTIVDAGDYAVLAKPGGIEFDLPMTVCGPGVARVTWTGGIAEDTASLVDEDSEYLDIVEAADLQVIHEMNRRQNPGGTSSQAGGGSTTYEGALKLLPRVLELLAPHERKRHG